MTTPHAGEIQRAYWKGVADAQETIAQRLESWGRESAGGDGEAINPKTGKRWGEEYFRIATMVRGISL